MPLGSNRGPGGGGSSGGSWTLVSKGTTTTIQSDATVNSDAALKIPLLANTSYRVRGTILLESTDIAGYAFDFTGPAAPTRVTLDMTLLKIDGTLIPSVNIVNFAAMAGTYDTIGIILMIKIDGTIENGANAGDFQFRWAQAVSTAVNTSALKGSYLEYVVVA